MPSPSWSRGRCGQLLRARSTSARDWRATLHPLPTDGVHARRTATFSDSVEWSYRNKNHQPPHAKGLYTFRAHTIPPSQSEDAAPRLPVWGNHHARSVLAGNTTGALGTVRDRGSLSCRRHRRRETTTTTTTLRARRLTLRARQSRPSTTAYLRICHEGTQRTLEEHRGHWGAVESA